MTWERRVWETERHIKRCREYFIYKSPGLYKSRQSMQQKKNQNKAGNTFPDEFIEGSLPGSHTAGGVSVLNNLKQRHPKVASMIWNQMWPYICKRILLGKRSRTLSSGRIDDSFPLLSPHSCSPAAALTAWIICAWGQSGRSCMLLGVNSIQSLDWGQELDIHPGNRLVNFNQSLRYSSM